MITKRLAFCCPKCGNDKFGSSNCNSAADMVRHCQEGPRPCDYQAHQDHDWKHFALVERDVQDSGRIVTTTTRFSSREHYEAVRRSLEHEASLHPMLAKQS